VYEWLTLGSDDVFLTVVGKSAHCVRVIDAVDLTTSSLLQLVSLLIAYK